MKINIKGNLDEYDGLVSKIEQHAKYINSLICGNPFNMMKYTTMINDFNYVSENFYDTDLNMYVNYLVDVVDNTIKLKNLIRKTKLNIISNKKCLT